MIAAMDRSTRPHLIVLSACMCLMGGLYCIVFTAVLLTCCVYSYEHELPKNQPIRGERRPVPHSSRVGSQITGCSNLYRLTPPRACPRLLLAVAPPSAQKARTKPGAQWEARFGCRSFSPGCARLTCVY